MESEIKKLLEFLKDKKVGIFCDDSNLYHAYQKYGWRIDFKKFRNFLEKYCKVEFINYYVVIPNKSDIAFKGTQNFLEKINSYISIKKKELKYTPVGGQVVKKGNMDVEIVLDVVRKIDDLDVIIILSGDSDFYELRNYVVKDKGKKIIFIAYKKNMAWEIKLCWHIFLERIRDDIKFKK
ncbi:MAG: NYN domain-containing protein [Minisyncoccales bacterium]